MKKNKPPEHSPEHFKNNPFKSLKRLKPAGGGQIAKETKGPAKQDFREDDADLFLHAMSGVRLLHPGIPGPGKQKQSRGAEPPHAGGPDEENLFFEAMRKLGAAEIRQREAYPEESPRRSASSRMRQLRRGTIRVREELDLHGRKRDEALELLERFIVSAYNRRQKTVLVITGKGINSPEGSVLQGTVSGWLRDAGIRFVAEFAPAPPNLGGSGAYVVFLRSRQGI